MREIILQINPNKELFLLYLLPVLFLLLIQYDFNYLVQGTIAFLFCLISLNAWMRIKDPCYRLSAALVITPLLLDRRTDCRAILIKCGSQGSDKPFQTGVLFFSGFNWIPVYRDRKCLVNYHHQLSLRILTGRFYHPILAAPNLIYFAWVCLPLSLIGAFVYPKGKNQSKKKQG